MQGTSTVISVIVVFVVAAAGGIWLQQNGMELNLSEAKSVVQRAVPALAPSPNTAIDWPPQLGRAYPDLALRNLDGDLVQLSDYRGKILFIEPIGMSCKACQAFSGGHVVGSFGGHQPQAGLKSIGEYVHQFGGGVSLDDARIEKIQILFYGPRGHRAPTLEQARDWAKHFGPFSPDTTVLFADPGMIRAETRAMIPGFHLVDTQFILRSDAGNPPRQDLYRTLIPMLKKVLFLH